MDRNQIRLAVSAAAVAFSLLIFALREPLAALEVIEELRSAPLYIHAYEYPHLHHYPNYSYFSEHRGRGWLYTRHDMVLHGYVVKNKQLLVQSSTPCDPSLVTIWARVTGPVVVAGKMTPRVVPNCEWVFDFEVEVAGEYKVEAKLVVWNGNAAFHLNRCRMERVASVVNASGRRRDEVLLRRITGFKFYDEAASCCEVCARDFRCTRWESDKEDKCRVYGKLTRKRKRRLAAVGEQRKEITSYFMGCGWSFYLLPDHPCNVSSDDDAVIIENPRFNVTAGAGAAKSLAEFWTAQEKLPYCSNLEDMARGRWVDLPPQVRRRCKRPKYDLGLPIAVTHYFPLQPAVCWMADNLPALTRRCMEPSCKRIRQSTEWRGSELLQTRSNYYGYWAPETCKLRYLSDKDVQQCVREKNLKGVVLEGASISGFLQHYFRHRHTKIVWMNQTDSKTIRVTTMRLPHLLWHESDEKIADRFKRASGKPFDVNYFLSTMFISSEREAHVNVDRGLRVTELGRKFLTGFSIIDWVNSSAAFAYETATQTDGLHIIGPPMKLVWTTFWNDLCQGVVFNQPY